MVSVARAEIVDVSDEARRRRRAWRANRWLLVGLPFAFWLFASIGAAVVGYAASDGVSALAALLAGALGSLALVALVRRGVGLPWRDPVRRRARELRSARRGGSAMLAVIFGLWAAMAAGLIALAPGPALILFALASVLFWPPAVFVAPRVASRWRRAAARHATEVRRRDPRAPVVFLRSFQADIGVLDTYSVARWLRAFFLSDWRGSTSWSGRGSLEDVLVDRLWEHGPVIAAARPVWHPKWGPAREELEHGQPMLVWGEGKRRVWASELGVIGAARVRLSDAGWQDELRSWLREAGLVVVMVADSDGLLWELSQLRELGLEDRVLFVLPPPGDLSDHELRAHWTTLCDVTGLGLPRELNVIRTRAVVPRGTGTATVLESARAERFDYEAAIDAAAGLVPALPASPAVPDALKHPPARATSAMVLALAGWFTGGWLPVAAVACGAAALALGIPVRRSLPRGLRGRRRATAAIVLGAIELVMGLALAGVQLATG